MSNRNNIPRVTKITFGVFKFLFGVIVNTFGEITKLDLDNYLPTSRTENEVTNQTN